MLMSIVVDRSIFFNMFAFNQKGSTLGIYVQYNLKIIRISLLFSLALSEVISQTLEINENEIIKINLN